MPLNVSNTRLIGFAMAALLAGCATQPDTAKSATAGKSSRPSLQDPSFNVSSSYLSSDGSEVPAADSDMVTTPAAINKQRPGQMQRLSPLPQSKGSTQHSELLTENFSDTPSLDIAVEQMPMEDFLHYTLGELLDVNYVLDEQLKVDTNPVTLNIKQQISPRRLMQLTQELLLQRGIQISYNDDLYYVHKIEAGQKGNVVTAIGRDPITVPRTAQPILQVVPLRYGVRLSIERTLKQLVGADITPDFEQGALFIQGKREEVIRALELVKLLDVPSNRGRYIGLIPLTYISSDDFTTQVSTLLQNEGIPVGTDEGGAAGGNGKSLVMVPVSQVGAVAVFAAEEGMLERVRYWAQLIDKPGQGTTQQYFIYHPRYARATDVGESLGALVGGSSSGSSATSTDKSAKTAATTPQNREQTGAAPSAKRATGGSNDKLTFVVDERANALIFHTSGAEYQAIMPLIEKLDVLPRQVMLDITIAEVTMSGEFKYGVEWAFKNGDFSAGTKNAFGVTGFGGLGLSLVGNDGSISANFIQSNKLVNVLSNPTLLVRDGVPARINVGSEISVVGSTTEDPLTGDRQTTSAEYRKTGVDITVTPTINAQGIVIMKVDQSISNTVEGSAGASGNPDIFERALQTEVVAQSGQTVILGGLISENNSDKNNKTPAIADVPVIGELFKAKEESNTRTELVMLITPRVLNNTDQWEELTNSFKQGLNYLQMGNNAGGVAPQPLSEHPAALAP
jgi:general secretion pathway protein D